MESLSKIFNGISIWKEIYMIKFWQASSLQGFLT